MLKKLLLTTSVAAALGACSAAAQDSLPAIAPAAPTPIIDAAPPAQDARDFPVSTATCDVQAQRTEHGVLIEGGAFAETDIDGVYELTIISSGANQSEISQSGDVSIAAGQHAAFGESEISFERGSRLRATVSLRDADGLICRETLRL